MFNSKPPAGSPAARTVLQQAANPIQTDQPPPAANDAIEAPAGPLAIKLTKPITTHAGLVREIALRKPTFTDYIANGDIDTAVVSGISADGQPSEFRVVTNHDAIMKWAVVLTGLDRLVLAQLEPADVGELIRGVRLAMQPFSRGNS